MGHALIWVESLAAGLLLVALLTACLARVPQRWGLAGAAPAALLLLTPAVSVVVGTSLALETEGGRLAHPDPAIQLPGLRFPGQDPGRFPPRPGARPGPFAPGRGPARLQLRTGLLLVPGVAPAGNEADAPRRRTAGPQ